MKLNLENLVPLKNSDLEILLKADGKIIIKSRGASNSIQGIDQLVFVNLLNLIDGIRTLDQIHANLNNSLSKADFFEFIQLIHPLFLRFPNDPVSFLNSPQTDEMMIPLEEFKLQEEAVVRSLDNGSSSDKIYKKVIIVGGGTAGYFTALAFRKLRPEIKVTIVESSKIPVIGVGEATTPVVLSFLHEILGIQPLDLYQAVKPSWKLGIKFDWGLPGDYSFFNPFGLNNLLESDHFNNSLDYVTLGTTLMMQGKGLIAKNKQGDYYSLLNQVGYAYHLENRNLIAFLKEILKASDIEWFDRVVKDVRLDEQGDVSSIITDGDEVLEADLFVDCSGFSSLLLDKTLKSEFIPFSNSLFTDRAVTGKFNIDGNPNPYTLAQSMKSGWNWNIPVDGENHRGYVHSSSFCTVEEAMLEMTQVNPEITDFKVVNFRSGRHKEFWKNNVVAIGNAYAFVEPLESTGLHMIIESIKSLLKNLPATKGKTPVQNALNTKVGLQWDYIKWFLAIHFKYNRKFETPYWQHCQNNTDISGIQELIDLYTHIAPLTIIAEKDPELLRPLIHDNVFGPHGFDYMLMGQKLPWGTQYKVRPELSDYPAKKAKWIEIAKEALSHKESLELIENHPELIRQII